jgi:transposase
MSTKELRRLHVIQHVVERKLTQTHAAQLLGLTDRQIRRLVTRVRKEGARGLIHRTRGRPSNRAIAPRRKARILRRYEARYHDFGPTLAAEKLAERDGITLSDETLRRWLLQTGVTHFRRRKRPHRQWRERKAHRGELVQIDGSHHAWLEARGPACVLMGYIDDATGTVFARFYEYEGTLPALDSFTRYIRRDGIPLRVYVDKHTTYKSSGKPTLDEQLQGRGPQSQFERALAELGVEVVHAHSPQAKGRIERLFGTFQDRLIKEMRLAGITTILAANRFLDGYLPAYNRRFAIAAVGASDLHRSIPPGLDLQAILCLKTPRVLRNDCTVAHNGRLYQVYDTVRTARVVVHERVDGTMQITHRGTPLRYQTIAARPRRTQAAVTAPPVRARRRPSPDHPWRGPFRRRGRPHGGLGEERPRDLPLSLGHAKRVSTGSPGPAAPGHRS